MWKYSGELNKVEYKGGAIALDNIGNVYWAYNSLTKLDGSGTPEWSAELPGVAEGIALGNSGDCWVAGLLFGHFGTEYEISDDAARRANYKKCFLMHFNQSGQQISLNSWTGEAEDVAVTALENIYLVGRFKGDSDLGSGPKGKVFSSRSIGDSHIAYLSEFDKDGNFKRAYLGADWSAAEAIAVGTNSDIWVVGNAGGRPFLAKFLDSVP